MTVRNDDELNDFDLSAWEAPPPPSGLADGVLARMEPAHAAAVAPVEHRAPRERRLGLIAGLAAACVAASAGTYVVMRTTHEPAPSSGTLVADRARSLSLGDIEADLDLGADVRWQQRGDVMTVEQRAGVARWRAGGDTKLVIDAGAAGATVEATGASLRVEVDMNKSDARVLGTSAVTAAAIATLTVVVYEGHVKVSRADHQTVVVQPGSTYTVAPAPAPVPVAIDMEPLSDVEPIVAGTPPQPASPSPQPASPPPRAVPESLDRDAIRITVQAARRRFAKCAERSTSSGTVKLETIVRPDGSVASAKAASSYDVDVGACMVDVMKTLRFPQTKNGGAFLYPFVMSNAPTKTTTSALPDRLRDPKRTRCDATAAKDKGLEHINLGRYAAALAQFEKALACTRDPYVVELAFMAACSSKNAAKAAHYGKQLTPVRFEKLNQICVRSGVHVAAP